MRGGLIGWVAVSICLAGTGKLQASPSMGNGCPYPLDSAWGPVVQGIHASLSVVQEPAPSEQQLRIRFVIHNLGPTPATLVNAGFWPNHRIDLTYESGQPVAPTELGQQARRAFSSGAQRKTVVRTLAPGQCVVEEHDIAALFELRSPATYKLRVTYQEGDLELPSPLAAFALPPAIGTHPNHD